ncbi:hypothetical protein O6H91_03G025900 [Diphasiastrum complanatum]|uniref:Uncharacterized protein n=1 Tax=Diphasiastrum complanatum TaxID=34168 RepID=A0ACC2E497_DIPCM|nr:hypothetical protein O6H91_Y176700 [Diphasiastrum complanatum]KAJ7561373.1 hypothetical protein O6H91_03G025900 [Diphasiastrum complanatum]
MEKQEQYALPQVRLALALALSKARGTKSSDAAIVSALEAKAELLKNEVVVLGQKVKEAEENVKELLLHVPSKPQCCQHNSKPNSFNANLALSYDSAVTNNALRHILRCASPAEKIHKVIIAADFIFELIGGSKSGAKGQCSQSLLCQSVEFLKDCVVFLLQESNNGVVLAERITKRILMLTTKKVLSFSSPQDLNGVFFSDHASLQHILFQLSYVPFIGQRLLLIASQQIAVVSEMVSHVDPFEDEKVTNTYENVFFM